jgi:hypothetical protein
MIICERCGKEMPDTAAICPSCGTASFVARPGTGVSAEYGQPPSAYPPPGYTPGYGPQSFSSPSQPIYVQQQGYGAYNVGPSLQPPISVNVNISAPIAAPASPGNPGAIIAEVLLNVFVGVYGVGWLMAGETTTGIILLICSILLYWPVMVMGAIFTLGVGLLCLIPLAIVALILNPILLNNTIKRKMAYILVHPMQPFPPR